MTNVKILVKEKPKGINIMLLTITYIGQNTSDLGYLLHKNPTRPQEFSLSYGKAYVFYPEVSSERTTAALLLDIDPIDLAKGKVGSSGGGLFDYVNDRPYVSSSFMSSAISNVFGTAMSGRSKEKQELADTPLSLSAKIHMLFVPNKEIIAEIFEPLGYTVEIETFLSDDRFPEWGESKHVNLTITGTVLLRDLLNHLYTLIPVFDTKRHYYISTEEVNKLLSHGEGWLKDHPKREYITSRYLNRRRSLVNKALEQLSGESEEDDEEIERKPNLNQRRLEAVVEEVLASGVKSVIDMGCGEGNLTKLLLKEQQLVKVAAFDASYTELERLKNRLHIDRMNGSNKDKLEIFQSSLTYSDKRFKGYDCACIIEVIEHLDMNRLSVFASNIFGLVKPKTVIITTPNIEYNENYLFLPKNTFRHGDHRFEWNREEFSNWASNICDKYGYRVEIKEIGDNDETNGSPTQMGVFSLCV